MAGWNETTEKPNMGKVFLEIARQHFGKLQDAPEYWCEDCKMSTPHTKRRSGDCNIMTCMTPGCGCQKALRLK